MLRPTEKPLDGYRGLFSPESFTPAERQQPPKAKGAVGVESVAVDTGLRDDLLIQAVRSHRNELVKRGAAGIEEAAAADPGRSARSQELPSAAELSARVRLNDVRAQAREEQRRVRLGTEHSYLTAMEENRRRAQERRHYTQLKLAKPRRCLRCGRDFTIEASFMGYECMLHPFPVDRYTGRYLCCGKPSSGYASIGCTRCDHALYEDLPGEPLYFYVEEPVLRMIVNSPKRTSPVRAECIVRLTKMDNEPVLEVPGGVVAALVSKADIDPECRRRKVAKERQRLHDRGIYQAASAPEELAPNAEDEEETAVMLNERQALAIKRARREPNVLRVDSSLSAAYEQQQQKPQTSGRRPAPVVRTYIRAASSDAGLRYRPGGSDVLL